MTDPEHANTAQQMTVQYGRRNAAADRDRYSLFNPVALHEHQARLRAMVSLWQQQGWASLHDKCFVEVGCGGGGNLLELLRLGAQARHLSGWELLPERVCAARACLPADLALHEGDASVADIAPASVDSALAFTVFSSILNDVDQARLAAAMWSWLKPGGAVLWYDFTFNNPRNPDVRGIPLHRIRALFPQGHITHRRVTLAPPIARAVVRVHPSLYPVFNALPMLRTHVLAWIAKT
jgi:SAM-dependent methyltransferase